MRVGEQIARIQGTSGVLSRLDVWTGLAQVAELERYVRPAVDDGFDLELVASRHPVLERLMARELHAERRAIHQRGAVFLVTGPNMAGKSTILRQIGLCVVLAQLGLVRARGFGPHRRGRPAFTRVGASDNLAQGQSTFMVEMSETSAILHNATARASCCSMKSGAAPRPTMVWPSRGRSPSTSTTRSGCKTMFATHYHELMQLPERLAHARNLNVAVRETGKTPSCSCTRLEAGGTRQELRHPRRAARGLPDLVVNQGGPEPARGRAPRSWKGRATDRSRAAGAVRCSCA